MRRLAQRLLVLVGLTLTTFGYLVFLWIRFLQESEKRGMIYLLGHWWDLECEVIFSCGVAGVTMLLIAWLKFPNPGKPGRCPSCGYDLRASPERCPECGTAAVSSGTGPKKMDI